MFGWRLLNMKRSIFDIFMDDSRYLIHRSGLALLRIQWYYEIQGKKSWTVSVSVLQLNISAECKWFVSEKNEIYRYSATTKA